MYSLVPTVPGRGINPKWNVPVTADPGPSYRHLPPRSGIALILCSAPSLANAFFFHQFQHPFVFSVNQVIRCAKISPRKLFDYGLLVTTVSCLHNDNNVTIF